jgi:hypothetical protein
MIADIIAASAAQRSEETT